MTEKITLISNHKKIKYIVEDLLNDNNIDYSWNHDYELVVSIDDYEKTKKIFEYNDVEFE